MSGGSDSLALLHLSHDWAQARGRDLIAFTFDHHLRDASADEAVRVGEICRALGIRHETLQWDAPVSRQSAARRARHAALACALKAHGGAILLTGHTADDQAETFLMRARQGSTWYGLAGMQALSPSPVWPEGEGVRIARPLLTARRSDLRYELKSRGADWVEDPTNDNPVYERVQMRQLLAGSPGLHAQISRCLTDVTALRAIEDVRLGRWLRDHVSVSGVAHITADMTMLGPESGARGMGILIQAVTGRETPPRRENLQSLADRVRAPRAFAGATLGCAKVSRQGNIVHLVPEAGLDGPDPLLIRRLTDLQGLLLDHA
ncbi:tRNA lysidine(34) synthetase TilS [Hyphomonas sp.]|uniref:tRNA lysidine(34) synthetase TilS n=1 Tax=Hyphomonas sp. TaxID=87 RepID=UPI0035664A0B